MSVRQVFDALLDAVPSWRKDGNVAAYWQRIMDRRKTLADIKKRTEEQQ
jgi:hypothetical protein